MANKALNDLTKEKLIELIDVYSKNWIALDGVWFQSVENKFGMDEAMEHDANAWEKYAEIEAKRIKAFLGLGEECGLEGLKKALQFRFYGNLNEPELYFDGEGALIQKMEECRVQTARKRKGMPLHPCKPVGRIEYSVFAKTIDERIKCECVSCYPDVTDESAACVWKFSIRNGK